MVEFILVNAGLNQVVAEVDIFHFIYKKKPSATYKNSYHFEMVCVYMSFDNRNILIYLQKTW